VLCAALLTEEDPDFTALIRSLLVQHRNALANVVRDASLADEVREDLDVETMLDCIVGAYLAERARNGVVQPGWVERVLRTLWPALTVQPANGPQPSLGSAEMVEPTLTRQCAVSHRYFPCGRCGLKRPDCVRQPRTRWSVMR
jgi:hypothetical protein